MSEDKRKGLPPGWQRAETLVGVPYYINHASEKTQWDHPEMALLMNEMSLADDIKYAAYRTAVKLRTIEKRIQVDSINLSTIRAAFNDLGYQESFTENEINVQQLEEILTEIFTREHNRGGDVNVTSGVELTLNWLLNVYNPTRSGSVHILSAKIALACLSAASVQEKYKYVFDQISSSKGFIDKKRLRVFLKDALQILKYVKEYHSFGRAGIEPTITSCFDRAFIPERISFQEFLEWMIDEPQTLVWLPTLHRLAMSETVKHEGKCNICKMFPIIGFRYRCLKCFNFDMCQNCFWSGRVAKNHKLRHQTQEYCLPATQKEDIKDFTKVIRSKVRKKKKKIPAKPKYLPIASDAAMTYASDEDADCVDYADNESTTSFESRDTDSKRLLKKNPKERNKHSPSEVLTSSPDIHDEHDLISYYSSRLNDKPLSTTSTPMTTAKIDRNQVREIEQIVTTLEEDNRYLREKILDIQNSETRRHLTQSLESDEREAVIEYNERLEARQEVLEDHNRRLEEQLTKLRELLHQKNLTLPGDRSDGFQNFLNGRNDVMSNHYQSTHHPSRPFNNPKSSQERLRPFSKLRDRSGDTRGSTILPPPPSKHSVRQNISREYNECEKESSSGMLGPGTSMSSDEDLRAIKVQLEELLEPDSSKPERKMETKPKSQTTLPLSSDSDSSDEQQQYLLTAASMVGEAMDGLVSNLTQEQSSWKHLDLDITDDEDQEV